jgi:hypothetical protein
MAPRWEEAMMSEITDLIVKHSAERMEASDE